MVGRKGRNKQQGGIVEIKAEAFTVSLHHSRHFLQNITVPFLLCTNQPFQQSTRQERNNVLYPSAKAPPS